MQKGRLKFQTAFLLDSELSLFGRPFGRRGGNGNRQRVQFVAFKLRLEAVFNQAVAGEAGFAFKGRGNVTAKK